MPDWLKTLALIVGLGGWLATVIATLMQGKLPDAATLGIPAALVIALAPPITIGRGRVQQTEETGGDPAPADGTDVRRDP